MLKTFSLNRVPVPDDLSALTSIDSREVPAEAADIRPDGADIIWQATEKLYRTGMNPAIALCVRRNNQMILNRTIGVAQGNLPHEPQGNTVPLNLDTPICLFSASKAITAMLIHWLDEQGVIHLLDPVARYIPEFAQHGKDKITLKQVLAHRSGLPIIDEDVDPQILFDTDAVIRMLCEAPIQKHHRHRMAYHALTGGFILGEVAKRTTGKSLNALLDEAIRKPMGMKYFQYGLAPEYQPMAAHNACTGIKPVFPLSLYLDRILGGEMEMAIDLTNTPEFMSAEIPAANIYCTAEEASRFFQMMLDHGQYQGKQIFKPETIRRATMAVSGTALDQTILLPMRYSMGMMLGHQVFSILGRNNPHAYGHLGLANIVCWADPDRALSCALLTTGKPLVGTHMVAWSRLLDTINQVCTPGLARQLVAQG